MAIAKSGLLRGLTGKTAGLVMTKTKQGTVVREYVENITNPRTPAQTANRDVFGAVVSNVAEVNRELRQLYGTRRMEGFAMLISMAMRGLGAREMNAFQGAVTEKIPAMLNQVAVNNNEEGLGVLNCRFLKLKFEHDDENDTFLMRAYFNHGITENANKVYFGCDYAIDELRIDTISPYGHISRGMAVTFAGIGGDAEGLKNVGLYDSIEACGRGWKYIYELPTLSRVLIDGQSFAGFTFYLPKANLKIAYLTGIKTPYYETAQDFVYGTFLLSSIFNSDNNAVNTKKGVLLLSSCNAFARI